MSTIIKAKIQKWGNGLGIRVSGAMRDIPNFSENSPVVVHVFEDGFSVRKVTSCLITLPFTEAQLLVGLESSTASGELLTYPKENEWV